MNRQLSIFTKVCWGLVTALLFIGEAGANDSSTYALTPLSLTEEHTPMVMLAMSNDEQLYYKAYPDYTDLDGDGVLDTVYKDSFRYAGYFNPVLCYQYDAANQYFVVADTNSVTSSLQHACDNSWSGNFLNWVSMTRMDLLRATLYGGKRRVDDIAPTVTVASSDGSAERVGRAVLERAYLPTDAHSFSKVISQTDGELGYAGLPLSRLVPNYVLGVSADVAADSLTPVNPTVTFCSTSNQGLPVLRVVRGSYPFWGAKEGRQCVFDGKAGAPATSEQLGSSAGGVSYEDMVVRVEACAAATDRDRCRVYTSDTGDTFLKPVGLLQKYGEDGRVNFGLITGSYHRNLEGGVIRKQISRIAGNTDVGTTDEINLQNGSFDTSVNGIIETLNKFQLVNYVSGSYKDCSTYKIGADEVKSGVNYDRACSNWGNPLAEIYYEALRYFAGNESALASYSDDVYGRNESHMINGLTYDSTAGDAGIELSLETDWTSPFTLENYCTKCAIVLLSSGIPSFDKDITSDLNGDVPGLTATKLNDATNLVGNTEYGSLASTSLIAPNGSFCTEVSLGNLKDVSGICPQNPSSEGSYHIAGLSYFSHVNDINSTWEGVQKIDTYAVELAESVPTIEFNVSGRTVALVPACQSFTPKNTDYTYCSLNDVVVEQKIEDARTKDLTYARLYVVWEDSQWGNDFDMDVVQRIDICTKDSEVALCDGAVEGEGEFTVKQQIIFSSGSLGFRTSFSLSGTTADGLQQGTNNSLWSTKNNKDGSSADRSWDTAAGAPTISRQTYQIDSANQAAKSLVAPLYLAAKFGGFVELGTDNLPTQQSEWDIQINTGADGRHTTGTEDDASTIAQGDGIPDNYYKVRNPALLGEQLGAAMNDIIERVSSGSNAAVVANRAAGNGAIYQAIYYPKESDGLNSVSWVGQLHSLFVDSAGLLREDTDQDGVLDDAPYLDTGGNVVAGDYIVTIEYNLEKEDTFFQRFALMGNEGAMAKIARPVGPLRELTDLDTIWSAAEKLAAYSDDALRQQRNYTRTSADDGRYVFTSVPTRCEMDNDESTVETCMTSKDFTEANQTFLATRMGFTAGAADASTAQATINFIRGIDQPGFRSRKINMDEDVALETWRLGDIVHSTPRVVEKASERYDLTLNDSTYEAFKTTYQNRRRMVYVGANDGLIHAFNGGFWNSICNGFFTQPITGTASGGRIQPSDCANGQNDSSLGSEMWAYAPYNLLPHLRWLTEPGYSHNFYVDGEPQSFDVRIFEPDLTHPNGWGTILVVPMRQGGGQISVDHDGDPATPEQSFQSAIVVLDITDPEQPPSVVAEITHPNLGFTLTSPALIVDYQPSLVVMDSSGNVQSGGTYEQPSSSNWYLSFGNGPYPIGAGNSSNTTSSQNAHLFVYDLTQRSLSIADMGQSVPESFLVGFQSRDWDGNGSTDSLYFGSVQGEPDDYQSGKLFRWDVSAGDVTSNISPKVLLNTGKPIVAKPLTTKDINGDRWIHVGTGRYYTGDDRQTTSQQRMYGVKDPLTDNILDNPAVRVDSLLDASNIKVLVDSEIYNADGSPVQDLAGNRYPDYSALLYSMDDRTGWFRDLSFDNGTSPSGRSLRSGLVYLDQLVFTEYLPSANQCDVLGRSRLHVISWKTGTALPYNPLGDSTLGNLTDLSEGQEEVVSGAVDLGVGEFSGVTVFETTDTVTLLTDADTISGIATGRLSAEDYLAMSDGNCVFVQSSTGEMTCKRVTSGPVRSSGRQSWREVEILF